LIGRLSDHADVNGGERYLYRLGIPEVGDMMIADAVAVVLIKAVKKIEITEH
jgi:hypothetical protein